MEKVFIAKIDSLDNGDNGCNASNSYLQKFFLIGERSVQKTLKSLLDKGLIRIEIDQSKKRSKRSIFSLLTPELNDGGKSRAPEQNDGGHIDNKDYTLPDGKVANQQKTHSKLIEIFDRIFLEKFSINFDWKKETGKQMSAMKSLRESFEKKIVEWNLSEDQIPDLFESFLKKINDKFILNNFEPSMIDMKFNSLLSSMMKNKNKSNEKLRNNINFSEINID